MRAFRRPGRDDLVQADPVAFDRQAEIERTEFVAHRLRVDGDRAQKLIGGMDRAMQTFLAIEMAEHRQPAFRADYDPFGSF